MKTLVGFDPSFACYKMKYASALYLKQQYAHTHIYYLALYGNHLGQRLKFETIFIHKSESGWLSKHRNQMTPYI